MKIKKTTPLIGQESPKRRPDIMLYERCVLFKNLWIFSLASY